jgi:hypothetical protein
MLGGILASRLRDENHGAEPATTDNDYDCPSRGGAALWASHSHV